VFVGYKSRLLYFCVCDRLGASGGIVGDDSRLIASFRVVLQCLGLFFDDF
jgi:hypothetical protein